MPPIIARPSSGLYVITPTDTFNAQSLLTAVEQALKGGVAMVQYRDKSNDYERRYDVAKGLVTLCQKYHAPLIINDDVALAKRVNASGVHLGKDDTPIKIARQALGQKSIIGVSCYNRLDWALNAQKEGADYVAFGRFFPSQTKPETVTAPLSLLAEARKKIQCPIVAIGGISLDNGHPLLAQGADFLAVVDSVFSSPKITDTALQFKTWFAP